MEHWAKMGEASNLEVENFKTCQVTLLFSLGPSYAIDILNTYSNFRYIHYIFNIHYIFSTYSICVSICNFLLKLLEETFTLTS